MKVRKTNPLARLHFWAWDTHPESTNICKVFWGTLFFWLGLIFQAAYRWEEKQMAKPLKISPPKEQSERGKRMEKRLEKIETWGSKWGEKIALGLASLWGLGLLTLFVVYLFNDFWKMLIGLALGVGVGVVIFGVAIGAVSLAERGVFRRPGKVILDGLHLLWAGAKSAKAKTCIRIEFVD